MSRMFCIALLTTLVAVGSACDRQEEQAPPGTEQSTAPQTPAPGAQEAPKTPQDRARVLLDELPTQLQSANWAEAEKILKQLESLKASVPNDMQIEIENAVSSYKAARAITEQGGTGQSR